MNFHEPVIWYVQFFILLLNCCHLFELVGFFERHFNHSDPPSSDDPEGMSSADAFRCSFGIPGEAGVAQSSEDGGVGGRHRNSIPDPLGKSRSASLRREASPICPVVSSSHSSPTSQGPTASHAKTFYHGPPIVGAAVGASEPVSAPKVHLQFPDLPPELQGVSVKDLVKALGQFSCRFTTTSWVWR